jgi:glycosyltransferase involved in cell wall biosynthesis
MKILYVGRNAKIGGGTTFRLNISRGLIPRGHQIWLAAWPGEMLGRYRQAGVRYLFTPPPPWSAPFVLAAIRKHGIDLVHASNTTPGDAAAWACARTGTPLVLSLHNILHRNDRQAPCLRSARQIIAFDDAAAKHLDRHSGFVDLAKVLHLPRPIEHRPHDPPEGEAFNLVYVGRLSQRKGQVALELLEAFRRFSGAAPQARLSLLGDGSMLGEVRRAAQQYNRERGERVIEVMGAVLDPAPVVSQAHVVIGAGYAALEALMQGIAVIGAGFRGWGPVVDDQALDAIKTNCGDSAGDWPTTTDNFLAALEQLHACWRGRGGRERERYWRLDRIIAPIHRVDAVAARLEDVYRQVLAAPRQASRLAYPDSLSALRP